MIGISSTRQYTPDDSSSSSSLSADDWYISLKSDIPIEPSKKLQGHRRRSRRSQGNGNNGDSDDDSIASHDSMKLRHRCPRRTTRIPAALSSAPKEESTGEGFSTMKRHVLPGKTVSSFQSPLCTTNVTTDTSASIPSSITIVLPTLPPRNTPPAMRRRCPAAA